MAGSNTETPTGKAEQKKQIVAAMPKQKKEVNTAPVQKKEETKEKIATPEANKKPVETKKKVDSKPKVKKVSASTNIRSMPVSTKVAVAICKFIKNKTIKKAIEDLEEVTKLKKAVPMSGEIPHRKGKMMSGRFPERAAKNFIVALKNLQSNSEANELENAIIKEAVPNQASRPRGKGGRTKKKRTHINLLAVEKKSKAKQLKEKSTPNQVGLKEGVPSGEIKEGNKK